MGSDTQVCDNHFRLGGVGHFRGHADAVQLGDVGAKKTPVNPASHLAVQVSIARNRLTIARAMRVDIHAIAFGGSDIGTSLAIPGVGRLGASTVARQLADRTLALVKMEAPPNEIVAAANASPDVIAALIRCGSQGRLVHQVFVIVEMKTALNFTRSARFEASRAAEAWVVTGADDNGSHTAVAFAHGTTFAYLLLEPKSDAKRPRQRIEAWADDPWSLQ